MFNKSRGSNSHPALPDVPPLPDAQSTSVVAPVPASAPSAPPRDLSTLSAGLRFEGSVSGVGDLQVEGSIKGDVSVGRLMVGETGSVEGNVSADYVEVRGRIIGAVSGKEVKMIATAYVDGDVTAEQLSIDIGAYFQGRVMQGQRDAPAALAAPAVTPVPVAPASVAPAPVDASASTEPEPSPEVDPEPERSPINSVPAPDSILAPAI